MKVVGGDIVNHGHMTMGHCKAATNVGQLSSTPKADINKQIFNFLLERKGKEKEKRKEKEREGKGGKGKEKEKGKGNTPSTVDF